MLAGGAGGAGEVPLRSTEHQQQRLETSGGAELHDRLIVQTTGDLAERQSVDARAVVATEVATDVHARVGISARLEVIARDRVVPQRAGTLGLRRATDDDRVVADRAAPLDLAGMDHA